MENQHQKWVSVSYLAFAALIGYILFVFSLKLAGVYDLETQIRNVDLIIRGISIAVGAIVFLVLYRNAKANQFMNEVVQELFRVTWPTKKETSSATFIVIVMVLITGLVLGFLDYLWTKVLQLVL